MADLHKGHRHRMHQKFSIHGETAFNDHEILEMLLYRAIPRSNTNPLAHKLLEKYETLEALTQAPLEELKVLEGVGELTAIYIKLIDAVVRRSTDTYDEMLIANDTSDAVKIITPYFERENKEGLFLLAVDTKKRVRYCGFLSEGSADSVDLQIKEIFDRCKATGSSIFYLAHNHPSGVAVPSRCDVRSSVFVESALTNRKLLMADHLVFADGDFSSFKDNSFLLRLMTADGLRKIVEDE